MENDNMLFEVKDCFFEQWKAGPNLADLTVWRLSYSHTGKWNNGFKLLRNLGVYPKHQT